MTARPCTTARRRVRRTSAPGPCSHVPGNVGRAVRIHLSRTPSCFQPRPTSRTCSGGARTGAMITPPGHLRRPLEAGVHQLIRVPGQRPYVKIDSNGRDEIALRIHRRPSAQRADEHLLRGLPSRSAEEGEQARDREHGERADRAQQADLVYNARRHAVPAWVWDVALDSHGRPVIVYATFPSRPAPRILVRRLDRHAVGFALPGDRRQDDQPRNDRIRVLGRDRP